jgi:hypothetical protein
MNVSRWPKDSTVRRIRVRLAEAQSLEASRATLHFWFARESGRPLPGLTGAPSLDDPTELFCLVLGDTPRAVEKL